MFPKSWQDKTLGDLISLQRGYDLPSQNRVDGNTPIMSAAGVAGFHVESNVKGPGIVIGRSGSGFGNVHFSRSDYWAHNTALFVKDFKGNDELYVFYLLNSIEFSSYNSGGVQPSLNRNFIYPIRVGIPTLPEQKKIAQILSTWDQAITATERLLENSQQRKKGLMQQLLTGKKRLPGFEGEWQTLNLGHVFEKVSNGVTYDATNTEGLPVTRIETISTGKVNFNKVGWAPDTENTRRFILKRGDILYSHINSLEHIGRVAYFNDEKPLYHGMNLLLLRINKGYCSKFFFHLLNSPIGKKYSKTYAKSAVNQASISTTDIKTFKVNFPPLVEQQAIAITLSKADQEITALERKICSLKIEKKALMQQLLTGKRRVKVDTEAA